MIQNHSDDYLQWDNTTSCVITLKRKAGNTTVNIAVCDNSAVTRKDAETLGIGVNDGGQSWAIPDKLFRPSGENRVIRKDDLIQETGSSIVYSVIDSTFNGETTIWDVVCVPQL